MNAASSLIDNQSFASLLLNEALINNLGFLSYEKMMPIQAKSLLSMLNGEDIIAQAKTGSDKTAAFGLSILSSLNIENYSMALPK